MQTWDSRLDQSLIYNKKKKKKEFQLAKSGQVLTLNSKCALREASLVSLSPAQLGERRL